MVDVLFSLVQNEDDHSAAKTFGVATLAQVLLLNDIAVYAVRKGLQAPIVRTFNKLYENVDRLFLPYPNITYPTMVNFPPGFEDMSNSFMDPHELEEKQKQQIEQRQEDLLLLMRGDTSFDIGGSNSGISPFYYDAVKTEPSRSKNTAATTTTTSLNRETDNNNNGNNNNNDDDVEMSDANSTSMLSVASSSSLSTTTTASSSSSTTRTSTNERETSSSTRMEMDNDDDDDNNHHNNEEGDIDDIDDDEEDFFSSDYDDSDISDYEIDRRHHSTDFGFRDSDRGYGERSFANRRSRVSDRDYDIGTADGQSVDLDSDSEDPDVEWGKIPDILNNEISKERLLQVETLNIIKALYAIAEYQEVIPILFEYHGFETVLGFLRSRNPFILSEILYLVGRLMTHKKFGRDFIEHGGLRLIISIPCMKYLSSAFSRCIEGVSANLQMIEQICLLPNPYPTRLISIATQLIGVTDVSTKRISQFFSEALTFRALTEIFEDIGGFEILFQNFNEAVSKDRRDIAVYLALCLRQHFRTVFLLSFYTYKLGVDRQSEGDTPGMSAPIPGYKSVDTEGRAMEDALETLEEMRRMRERAQQGDPERDSEGHYSQHRYPNHQPQSQQQQEPQQPPPLSLENVQLFKKFLKNDGMRKVLKAIDMCIDGDTAISEDLLQYSLELIHVLTFIPQAQLALLEPISKDKPMVGMGAVLNAARKDNNPEIILAALNIIVNCMCTQQESQLQQQQQQQQEQWRGDEGAPMNVLSCLRNLDGVNLFIKLLNYSRHLDSADEIHKLACRALLGMTCDQPIAQILSTLDISSILAGPLKQPAHPDKIRHYKAFRQYGVELISKMYSNPFIHSTNHLTIPITFIFFT